MSASPRRIVAVMGLLAAIAYVIFTSSQSPAPPGQAPGASVTPVPSASSERVASKTPDLESRAPESPSPVATTPAVTTSGVTSPVVTTTGPKPMPPASSAAIPVVPTGATPPSPAAPPPAIPTEDDSTALENDLEHVQMMVREYRTAVGENPIGTNAEIMKAVLGNNLKQAKIGAPEGQSLNAKGELVDRWGTPYFFHQVSKTEMEVRSAGPDREMWTGDDREL